MADVIEQNRTEATPETDLVAGIRNALAASPEPLTLSKLRSSLPSGLRSVSVESLAETLRRQVAANVLYQYPRYRSPQDRFWDRPMEVHLAYLLRTLVGDKALPWSDIRRKLPDYARSLAESVLESQVARGELHRHPPLSSRTGPRFGVNTPNPREFLNGELSTVFLKLRKLGFSLEQLRQGALEILHEEEWSPAEPIRPDRVLARASQPANEAGGESRPVEGSPEPPALFGQA